MFKEFEKVIVVENDKIIYGFVESITPDKGFVVVYNEERKHFDKYGIPRGGEERLLFHIPENETEYQRSRRAWVQEAVLRELVSQEYAKSSTDSMVKFYCDTYDKMQEEIKLYNIKNP